MRTLYMLKFLEGKPYVFKNPVKPDLDLDGSHLVYPVPESMIRLPSANEKNAHFVFPVSGGLKLAIQILLDLGWSSDPERDIPHDANAFHLTQHSYNEDYLRRMKLDPDRSTIFSVMWFTLAQEFIEKLRREK